MSRRALKMAYEWLYLYVNLIWKGKVRRCRTNSLCLSRILHCNVIIELKDDEFRHADLSQLNAYVSYFREHEMNEGDNPPVGILLCTRKGEKMVEYALAGMDNNLFVSTYMLSLPDKQILRDFLMREIQS